MKPLKSMLLYWSAITLSFYLLPLLIKDTGSAMAILLIVLPLICLVCSLIYGSKHSFHWLFALVVAVLFIPTIFIFYNTSAWVYSIGYGAAALVGNLLGACLRRPKT